MSNTNTPQPMYALTPIDQTEGLEDGKYIFTDMFSEIRNVVMIEFNNAAWQAFTSYTHYLRPLPEGTRVLKLGEVAVSEDFIQKIKIAFSDYVRSEGCSCCRNIDDHKDAEVRLGELLDYPKYEDGSGYNFY